MHNVNNSFLLATNCHLELSIKRQKQVHIKLFSRYRTLAKTFHPHENSQNLFWLPRFGHERKKKFFFISSEQKLEYNKVIYYRHKKFKDLHRKEFLRPLEWYRFYFKTSFEPKKDKFFSKLSNNAELGNSRNSISGY